MPAPFEDLRAALARVVRVPEAEFAFLCGQLGKKSLRRGEPFARIGDRPREVAFVRSGLFRQYYLSPEGTEHNKVFSLEGSFMAPFGAILRKERGLLQIEAVEDSDLYTLSVDRYEALFDRHVCWERFGRRIAEDLFSRKEQREFEFLMLSPEERYAAFLETNPGLEERLTQYHIASYIGVTPVALSRIRGRVKKKSANALDRSLSL